MAAAPVVTIIRILVILIAVIPVSSVPNTLAIQWPPTTCAVFGPRNCDPRALAAKEHRGFTIHGLWPVLLPNPCLGGPRLDSLLLVREVKRIEGLMQDLKWKWPTYFTHQDPKTFWASEWTNHGACTDPLMGIGEYFAKAVALYDGIYQRVKNELEGVGIVVGEPLTGPVLRGLMQNLPNSPVISCKRRAGPFGYGPYLLAELRYCVNDEGTEIINCQVNELDVSCPIDDTTPILFPSFNYNIH